MEHPRRVGGRILTEEQDAVGFVEVFEKHGPTGAPMTSGNATEVDSWHMFELSGKLLVPYMRPNSWNM
jgi:hypothetical protein